MIHVTQTRISRPKGPNKPFWEFSKSKRPLSLKKMKRKCEGNGLVGKFREPDCSQSGFIRIHVDKA